MIFNRTRQTTAKRGLFGILPRLSSLAAAVFAFTLLLAVSRVEAADGTSSGTTDTSAQNQQETQPKGVHDPSYRLAVKDQIQVAVFGESDLGVTGRIDGSGTLRIPLLGNVSLDGLTVRQAEEKLQKLYVKDEILRSPSVTINVLDYATREVTVFGEVRNPGKIPFPPGEDSMDILDLIAKAGGFTKTAKGSEVQITRRGSDGHEIKFTVDVSSMYQGRGHGKKSEQVPIYPGDIVNVPQSIW